MTTALKPQSIAGVPRPEIVRALKAGINELTLGAESVEQLRGHYRLRFKKYRSVARRRAWIEAELRIIAQGRIAKDDDPLP